MLSKSLNLSERDTLLVAKLSKHLKISTKIRRKIIFPTKFSAESKTNVE
jgi:hypothetical protein